MNEMNNCIQWKRVSLRYMFYKSKDNQVKSLYMNFTIQLCIIIDIYRGFKNTIWLPH